VSSIVKCCIETQYSILVLVAVVTPCFLVVAVAVTIIGLADCLYDVFMDEESSSTAKATAAAPAATRASLDAVNLTINAIVPPTRSGAGTG
jgi:hypothetical protein